MKHLRLLTAAIAVIFALGASAWDGSEGKVYLQNVGSGLWWGAGNSWGTQASLIKHPEYVILHKQDNGTYQMETQVSNGGTSYYFNGSFMDNGSPVSLTFTDAGDGYTIGDGTIFYGYDGASTVLATGSDDRQNNFKWKVYSEDDILALMKTATEENPVDVSCFIKCANFGRNNRDANAWTFTAGNPSGGPNENRVAEIYEADATATQTLSVPNGRYIVKAQAAVTYHDARVVKEFDGGTPSQIFGNDATGAFIVMDESDQLTSMDQLSQVMGADENKYLTETGVASVTDGTLNIGVKTNRKDIWCLFDNFQLYYLGEVTDLSAYIEGLELAVNAAKELEGTIPAAAYSALAAVVEANNKTYKTADEYSEAINAIKTATDKAKTLQEPYAEYKTIYPIIKALADVADYKELKDGVHATLVDALTTLANQVESATTPEAVTEVNAALRAAGVEYANNAEPTGDAKFDLTFMLTNPDFTKFWTGAWNVHPEGWYTDQPDGNFQVMSNNDANNGEHNVFLEYWSENPKSDNTFTLYTKLDLAAGIYNMSCYAFSQQSIGGDVRGIKFYANDTEGSTITTDKLNPASIEFVNQEAGEVKIGLKATEGNTYRWMGIGYVELYKLPNVKEATIADNDAKAPEAGAYTTINADIKLLKGLNTLVLPFATTKEEIGAEMVFAYNGSEKRGNNLFLTFTEVDNLSANTPYLIRMAADAALPNFENKTVAETTNLTVADGNSQYDFVGTYAAYAKGSSPILEGDYIAGVENIVKANGGNGIKAYRAYLKKVGDENISYVALEMNGEVIDGIDALKITNGQIGDIYNLNGQKVSKAQKGVYIINGQKVVVK